MFRIMGEEICLCDVPGWNINLTTLQLFIIGCHRCCKNNRSLLLFFAGMLVCIQLRR